MYDPEENMRMEAALKVMRESSERLIAFIGEEHYISVICRAFCKAFAVLFELRRRINECWDEKRKSSLEDHFNSLGKEIIVKWEEFGYVLKREFHNCELN